PDFENEIDTSVAANRRRRLYLNLVTAVSVIGLDDARHILTHRRFGHRTAWLETDLVSEILVLDLLVALEPHIFDLRRFNDGNDQARAGPDDMHLLKQTGPKKFLQCGIDRGRGQPLRRNMEVFADGLRVDAAIALNHNRRLGCDSTG